MPINPPEAVVLDDRIVPICVGDDSIGKRSSRFRSQKRGEVRQKRPRPSTVSEPGCKPIAMAVIDEASHALADH